MPITKQRPVKAAVASVKPRRLLRRPKISIQVRDAGGGRNPVTSVGELRRLLRKIQLGELILDPSPPPAPTAQAPVPQGKPERAESGGAWEYVQGLKAAEGGAWSSAELEEKASISRQALKERRDSFGIVYWTDAKGHSFYPKWQFDANLRVLPEVREILRLMRTTDTTHVLNQFLAPSIGDAGESVLGLIKSGRGAEAVAWVHARMNE